LLFDGAKVFKPTIHPLKTAVTKRKQRYMKRIRNSSTKLQSIDFQYYIKNKNLHYHSVTVTLS